MRILVATTLIGALIIGVYSPLFADTPEHSSTNFGINESFIGAGGQLDSSSANYQAQASLGDTGIGNSVSTNFQQYAGFTTTDAPFIEFSVTASTVDLGILTTGTTGTGTATFYVRNYISEGYVVTTISDTPGNQGSDTLDPIAAAAASDDGTEQFGINLKVNTSPAAFGADPVQVPDSTFSFGDAASGYDTADVYQYNVDDTIAESTKSTGQTTYTISYIANISEVTPAGIYTMGHILVATATY